MSAEHTVTELRCELMNLEEKLRALKIDEVLELVEHYESEYWWFDSDCIISDLLEALQKLIKELD